MQEEHLIEVLLGPQCVERRRLEESLCQTIDGDWWQISKERWLTEPYPQKSSLLAEKMDRLRTLVHRIEREVCTHGRDDDALPAQSRWESFG